MSLQRRLLLYLLVAAPLVWAVGLWISVDRASHEVNELFDSELIRLARQVQATLNAASTPGSAPAGPAGDMGEADVRDLAIVVWDREGRQLMADREGAELPYRRDASGFVEIKIGDEVWRTYYLQSFDGSWLVAAGQKAMERSELVFDLTASQLVPWLLVLPVLLLAMTWGVQRALAPVHQLTRELADRGPDDLKPVAAHAPTELAPLVVAMNGLFSRIDATLARERRFTADAAHELRTPLAVLRAQWDVVRRASALGGDRAEAERQFALGLDRLDRLVTQLLALSRLDDTRVMTFDTPIRWAALVEEVMSDVLPLAEQRRTELACEWPEGSGGSDEDSRASAEAGSLPLKGDAHLMRVLLRNLLDNAVRYAPPGSGVTLSFEADRITVENGGPALVDAVRSRLGERFYRPDGQDETGSGLGVSIARRIAELHGLTLAYSARDDGTGVRATLMPDLARGRSGSATAT